MVADSHLAHSVSATPYPGEQVAQSTPTTKRGASPTNSHCTAAAVHNTHLGTPYHNAWCMQRRSRRKRRRCDTDKIAWHR